MFSARGSYARMVEFEYQIREAQAGRELASGATKHLFLGPDMRPVKLPDKYYPMFGITSVPYRT